MGCLRVDKVLDYLCEPLRRALRDENAYVRKTAAICVAKVVELSPELAEENGFLEMLHDLLADSNASVLANVVAALADIHAQRPEMGVFRLDSRTASRLVAVLGDCTEWGQTTILDVLATYVPETEAETVQFLETITPRLQHANCSVVLSAVKVILVYLEHLSPTHSLVETLKRKLAPPLVSLLSSPGELQYVALRNINLIVQRHPDILAQGVRVFFCKFNDPLYCKLEKLEIIVRLVSIENWEQVLAELGEYAKEVDVQVATRSILAMAQCTGQVPLATPRVLSIFGQLLALSSPSTTQAITMALPLVLRTCPDDSLGLEIVQQLLADEATTLALVEEILDEDEAREALVWILGQYGPVLTEGIVTTVAESFSRSFTHEASIVQSELLTTALILTQAAPSQYRCFLEQYVTQGMSLAGDADLRERAILYGRLLQLLSAAEDDRDIAALMASKLCLSAPRVQGLAQEALLQLLPHLSNLVSITHNLKDSMAPEAIPTSALSKPPPLPDLLDLDPDGDKNDHDTDVGDSRMREALSTIPENGASPLSPPSTAAVDFEAPPIVDLLAD